MTTKQISTALRTVVLDCSYSVYYIVHLSVISRTQRPWRPASVSSM